MTDSRPICVLSDETCSFTGFYTVHLLLVNIDLICRFRLAFLLYHSPSQGPCCNPGCEFKGRNEKCRNESDCAFQGMCSGSTAQCPTSMPKDNLTACHGDTQVCISGVLIHCLISNVYGWWTILFLGGK